MNAPKEYYPVGYDKNFDDNFKSKIDLPATSFHCGDQKHFPGLYGDQDLGCMVSFCCFQISLQFSSITHGFPIDHHSAEPSQKTFSPCAREETTI